MKIDEERFRFVFHEYNVKGTLEGSRGVRDTERPTYALIST